MSYLYNNAYKICNDMIENRNPDGYFYKSDIYYFGYGADINKDKAFNLLEKAIKLNHKDAQDKLNYHMGFMDNNLENNMYHCKNKYNSVFKKCDSEYICFYK